MASPSSASGGGQVLDVAGTRRDHAQGHGDLGAGRDRADLADDRARAGAGALRRAGADQVERRGERVGHDDAGRGGRPDVADADHVVVRLAERDLLHARRLGHAQVGDAGVGDRRVRGARVVGRVDLRLARRHGRRVDQLGALQRLGHLGGHDDLRGAAGRGASRARSARRRRRGRSCPGRPSHR